MIQGVQDSSIFWLPPAEIRCRIYGYAFASDDVHVTNSDFDRKAPHRKRAVENFLVSRLFYREAYPVFAAQANFCFQMREPRDIEAFVRKQQLACKVLKKLGRDPTLGAAAQPIFLDMITTITIIWDRPEIRLPGVIGGFLLHLKHVHVHIYGAFVPKWAGIRLVRKLREYEDLEPKDAVRTLGLEALGELRGLRTFEMVVQRSGELRAMWLAEEWEVWRGNLKRVERWLRRRVMERGMLCRY